MKSIKVSLLILALTLTACETPQGVATTADSPKAPAAAKTVAQSCHSAMVPITAAQHTESDQTVFKCTYNCGALPFNQITFMQMAPVGAAPVGQIRADIADVGPSMTQPLGCYQLGAGTDPVTITGNQLRLGISAYSCAQRIPQHEVYTITQNCNELDIEGAIFAWDSVAPGF